jgi:alginate O-acetyltransferase complex protein AlgI
MIFNSIQYALFLPIVLGVYWLLDRRKQNALLLAASYYFYAVWDIRFLFLMWVSTLTDFTIGRLLDSTQDERRRKRIFFVSLLVNLGILGFFKYFNFFVDSAVDLLNAFGLEPNRPSLNILLPVGISFYTFHGISYTFDVYRREIEASKDLLDFACFVAYFPQLVAGPIGRAQIQLPQFANPRRRPRLEDFRSGIFLILLGLFKKVAIADALAPFVNTAFAKPGANGGAFLVVGAFAFVLQVYGDFSGYSDMARGSSRLFGIELLRNFEQPFLSRSITELWRRWHISLATWLRDYLYLPLGGNRVSSLRFAFNTMVVMLIAGLWHGAAWTFVAWGGINGVFLIVERWFSDRKRRTGKVAEKRSTSPIGGELGTLPVDLSHESSVDAAAVKLAHRKEAPLPPPFVWRKDLLPTLYTILAFTFGAIFFRAASFTDAWNYLKGILAWRPGSLDGNAVAVLLVAAIFSFGLDILQRNTRDETFAIHWPAPARALMYGTFVLAIMIFSGGTPIPFIYFQF